MNTIQKIIKYGAMAFAAMLAISILGAIVTFLFGIMVGVERETKSGENRISVTEEYTKEQIEEERRLLYVAVTRAIDAITIYFTGERGRKPSRFLTGEKIITDDSN